MAVEPIPGELTDLGFEPSESYLQQWVAVRKGDVQLQVFDTGREIYVRVGEEYEDSCAVSVADNLHEVLPLVNALIETLRLVVFNERHRAV